jgi:hypothetical protein
MAIKKRLMIVLAGLTIAILLVYFILPRIVFKTLQRHIEQMENYSGSIQAVHIGYLPLGLTLEGLQLKHKEATFPIISTANILIKPHWPLFYKGALMLDAVVIKPQINLVAKKSQAIKLPGGKKTIQEQQRLPIMVHSITFENAKVQFYRSLKDGLNNRPIFAVWQINGSVNNLTGKPGNNSALLPSSLELSGKTYGNAPLHLHVAFNPLALQPTFDLDGELKQLNLAELNPMLRSYTGVKVRQGLLSLYIEAAAANGKITGYVKPLLQGLQVQEPAKTNINALDKFYQRVVEKVNKVLENNNTKASGTRIPIRGNINDPHADLWSVILELLRNAFIQALLPRVDQSIQINDVLQVSDLF